MGGKVGVKVGSFVGFFVSMSCEELLVESEELELEADELELEELLLLELDEGSPPPLFSS